MIGKRQPYGNIDNIVSYTMSYNSINILRMGVLSLSIVKKIHLICEEAKSHVCKYFKTMRESIYLALQALVVIEHIAVKFTEFRDISLYGRALEVYNHVKFHKGSILLRK